jgi:hypothetical protein
LTYINSARKKALFSIPSLDFKLFFYELALIFILLVHMSVCLSVCLSAFNNLLGKVRISSNYTG